MVGLAVHIKNTSTSLIGIIKTSDFVIKYNNIICTMYPVSYHQDKQLQMGISQGTLWACLKTPYAYLKRSSQWILFIKYLLPSSSKSLENYILVYYIYSIYRNWPWTYQSGQMSIILPYPFVVDHFYRYPNHPYLCHYHTPAYDTYLLLQSHNLLQAQILDKEAITNKDQNDSDEEILEMEERTKGGMEPE